MQNTFYIQKGRSILYIFSLYCELFKHIAWDISVQTLVLMLRQFVFCSIPVNEKNTCLSLFFSSCLPCAERFPHGKIHVLHWFMGWLQQTVAVSTLFANLKLVLLAFSLDSRRALWSQKAVLFRWRAFSFMASYFDVSKLFLHIFACIGQKSNTEW